MSKIVLNEAPTHREECPMYELLCKGKFDNCWCVGGYYDSPTFEFDKCPHCQTLAGTSLNITCN